MRYVNPINITENIGRVVNWVLKELNLIQYIDTIAANLSGGNKRKLSTAIALTGSPDIIFLDEPTAGVDPKARQFLWKVIKNLVERGRCIMLTSHSMEECEMLCGRMAFLVQGGIKCIGSAQHLKDKFGGGYLIQIRTESGNQARIVGKMKEICNDVVIKEEHDNMMVIQIFNIHSIKVFISLSHA